MPDSAGQDTQAQDVGRVPFLGLPFDPVDAEGVLSRLAARTSAEPFGYVVTPNVQHVVRADKEPELRPFFEGAWLSLCDSRPVKMLAGWSGLDLPLVTGSDLTVAIFERILAPGDRIAVICASDDLAAELRSRRPEFDWVIHVPPPGTDPGTAPFDACVDFIAENDARLVFVCLGAPKSERMCHAAAARQGVTGTALCTGASLEFMLGLKARAPKIFQRLGLEWLHRMLSEPRRLARRYLSAFIPLARIWLRERRRRAA